MRKMIRYIAARNAGITYPWIVERQIRNIENLISQITVPWAPPTGGYLSLGFTYEVSMRLWALRNDKTKLLRALRDHQETLKLGLPVQGISL